MSVRETPRGKRGNNSQKYLRKKHVFPLTSNEQDPVEDLRDYTPLVSLKSEKKDKKRKNVAEKGPESKNDSNSKVVYNKLLKTSSYKVLQSLYALRPFNLLRFLGIPIISRYITAEFLFSFFISFTFFFFIFLVNALLLVARKYAGEGLPLWAILQLIYYNIPTNVSLSLPFAVLVGALMAISHLGASNQMLAFRSCSVRRTSILIPLLICSILASVGSFIFSDYYLPLGRINTQKIILQLLSNNPKVVIQPYSVRTFRSDNGRNTYIISGPVRNDQISELVIVDYDQDLNRRVFFAKTARLADDRPSGVVPFLLTDVNATIANNIESQKFSYMTASSLLYNVLLGNVTETYRLTPDDRQSWEMILQLRQAQQEQAESKDQYDMRTAEYFMHYRSVYKGFYTTTDDTLSKKRLVSAYNAATKRPADFHAAKIFNYKMALYIRLAIPFSCIPFMILAFSLGSLAKRYGRSIGFLLGLVLSGIFWFSLAGGRLLGRSNTIDIPPFFLMFSSNILFLVLGIFLILRQKR